MAGRQALLRAGGEQRRELEGWVALPHPTSKDYVDTELVPVGDQHAVPDAPGIPDVRGTDHHETLAVLHIPSPSHFAIAQRSASKKCHAKPNIPVPTIYC